VNAASGAPSDTQPPTVSFASPASGTALSGSATIQVSATDNVGVTSIVVTANGATIGSSTTAPYTFSWNTTTIANGSYTLVATAKDAAGNSASASVVVTVSNSSDTTAPTVSITYPIPGSGGSVPTLTGTVSLTAQATDNVGVVKVQYYCDNKLIGTATSAPFVYKWNTKKVTHGLHTLQAKAYDAAGNVGVSTSVTVMVQ
jgi:hypothetical protein